MINLDGNDIETLVIPLTGVTESFPTFNGTGHVVLEKIIGGQKYSFDAEILINKCEDSATVSMDKFPPKTKEGQYRMRIYIKEINKVYLTLANIKYGISKRRN